MPRIVTTQWSFTSGEVAPSAYGRADLQKYASGVQRMENYVSIPQGGVVRRPGIRFIAEAACTNALVIVRPFIFSTTQAYILEIGAGYIHFYRNNARVESGGNPVAVSTPYAASQLRDIDYVQSADVLLHLTQSCETRVLERYGDTCWRFRKVPFAPPPSVEYGARPVANLAVSAVSGDNVTATAHTEDAFFASDVGREILVFGTSANAGARAGIKSVTNARAAVITICEPFLSLAVTCTGLWRITESPRTTITPSAKDPVGAAVTLTLGLAGWRGSTGLSDGDCGRFALINGGTFELTCVQSTTVANAVIRGEASSASAGQSGAWTLEESRWSTERGFAQAGDFFGDRLYLDAGIAFCGSKTSDYYNFAAGIQDDDAVTFPINSKQINTIRGIVGARQLQLFTAGGEYVATGGGNDDPITATNVRVGSQTTHGSRGVPPLRVGDATLFVSLAGKQLREFTIPQTAVTDKYAAPDLLLLADHLVRDTTVVELAYQREPHQRIWAVLADGRLLCCTYRREENVVAWSQHTTCGAFESVAVIPHPDGDRDQVWVTTALTVCGTSKRYIGYLDDCTFFYRYRCTDQAITCNPGSAVTTVGGLNHLAGMVVAIQGDGAVYPDQTVGTCGQIVITPAASKIEVGLPYTSTLTTLRPEIPVGGMSSFASKMRWPKIIVRLFETLGMSLATDGTVRAPTIIPFRKANDILGQPPPLFTGLKEYTHTSWDCGVISVIQDQPLPSTLLTLGGVLDLGDVP